MKRLTSDFARSSSLHCLPRCTTRQVFLPPDLEVAHLPAGSHLRSVGKRPLPIVWLPRASFTFGLTPTRAPQRGARRPENCSTSAAVCWVVAPP